MLDIKYCNSNEECLLWAHQQTDRAKERINKFEDRETETFQTENQRGKQNGSKRRQILQNF